MQQKRASDYQPRIMMMMMMRRRRRMAEPKVAHARCMWHCVTWGRESWTANRGGTRCSAHVPTHHTAASLSTRSCTSCPLSSQWVSSSTSRHAVCTGVASASHRFPPAMNGAGILEALVCELQWGDVLHARGLRWRFHWHCIAGNVMRIPYLAV
jgi:hypothetical protein